MIDFELTDDQRVLQKSVRELCDRLIVPHAHDWDEEERFPHEVIKPMGEMGLFGMQVPEEPLLFLKPSTSVIGPGDTILSPLWAGRVDHEAELGVVIGRLARDVRAARALCSSAGNRIRSVESTSLTAFAVCSTRISSSHSRVGGVPFET